MSVTIQAPWTDEQVSKLNEWQTCNWVHPFTCGVDRSVLIANNKGFYCPNCAYEQTWAHEFMFHGAPHMPFPRVIP